MPNSVATSVLPSKGRRLGHICGVITVILMAFISREGLGAEPAAANLGHLYAVASVNVLPLGIRIAIEPGPDDAAFGNAPLYIAVRDVIKRELARRGLQVGGASNLTLEIRIDITGFQARRRQHSETFPGLPPPPGYNYDRSPVVHQFVIPLGERLHRSPSKTSIVLVLFRPSEPPLWSATVTAATHGDSAEVLVSRLTKVAMEAFGMSAKRSFVLH